MYYCNIIGRLIIFATGQKVPRYDDAPCQARGCYYEERVKDWVTALRKLTKHKESIVFCIIVEIL